MRVVAIVGRVRGLGGRWCLEGRLLGGGEGIDRSKRRTVFSLGALAHRLIQTGRFVGVPAN